MFFSNFPYVAFTINGSPGVITDFFRRVAANTTFAAFHAALTPYQVLDGETPDLMSNRFYGSPEYHWVLLMINNMTNPFVDWALPSKMIDGLVFDKYDFVVLGDGTDLTTLFAVGDVVESDTDGIFTVNAVTKTTVNLRSRVGRTILTTSSVLENVTQNISNIAVTAITDPTEGVHHYEDAEGNWIDFDSDRTDITTITNLDFETALNDGKRVVYVLDPDYLTEFVQTFKRAIVS